MFVIKCVFPLFQYLVLVCFFIPFTSGKFSLYQSLDANFCHNSKLARSIYSTPYGIQLVYKDPAYRGLRLMTLLHQFMEDQFIYITDSNEEFNSAGLYIPHFKMHLLIGIRSVQIEGYFINAWEKLDITYSIYFLEHMEQFSWDTYTFTYNYFNKCYLQGCISDWNNFFRVYRLGFCHDTNAKVYFPLNQPCYNFFGKNTSFTYSFWKKGKNGKLKWVINPRCIKNSPIIAPNFCKVKNETKATLNTLFPKEFSANSQGNLFRTLVYGKGHLLWIEHEPLRYRFLADLRDPDGDYTDKWRESFIQKKFANDYFFSGAITFPQFGTESDQIYIMLLPKNFTFNTAATYRRVTNFDPLEFDDQVFALDEILLSNCSQILADVSNSKNSQLFPIILVVVMLIFLAFITCMTQSINFDSDSTSLSKEASEQAQSAVLSKLRQIRKQM